MKARIYNFVAGISPDVALPNENASVMDRLGKSSLEDQSLQSPFQKVLHSQSQHKIELVLGLIQKSVSVHTPQQSLTLKNTAGGLLVHSKEFSGIVSDTRKCILHTPQLSL